jgi:phosphoribosylformimino-5-aminoimidazole carboxamide ribotide isomerase
MKIIPAIDLKDGKCVRLYKGDFNKVTEYSDDPLRVAAGYDALDVADLHIVDLDGARTGSQHNRSTVSGLCASTGLAVQLGGGIRDLATVNEWLAEGVSRCVVGSVAVDEPTLVGSWMDEVGPDRIVVALDVTIDESGPVAATHGWTRSSGKSLWDSISKLTGLGLRHVLCTDISRDGAMAGPNFDLYAEILARYPDLQVQASGGVRHIGDLECLRDLGVPAAITGKALLDGRITAAEVSSFRQNA